MATTRENLDYIDAQPDDATFYVAALPARDIDRDTAIEYAKYGYDVINDDDVLLSV